MPQTNGFDSIEAEIAAKKSQITTLLQDNLLNVTEFYIFLEQMGGCDLTESEIRKQLQCAIIVTEKKDASFALAANMSQCDACGVVGVGLPKMLTCGDCKGYHYCSRKCQKKDWRNAHKLLCTKGKISREHFKTTDACMNILAVLCIDWETEAMNSENNYVRKHIEKSGCKDFIYVCVYDKKRVYYIPMPLKILNCLKTIADKDDTLASSFEKVDVNFDSSNYIVLLVPTKVQGCSIMVKTTSVLLPWASE